MIVDLTTYQPFMTESPLSQVRVEKPHARHCVQQMHIEATRTATFPWTNCFVSPPTLKRLQNDPSYGVSLVQLSSDLSSSDIVEIPAKGCDNTILGIDIRPLVPLDRLPSLLSAHDDCEHQLWPRWASMKSVDSLFALSRSDTYWILHESVFGPISRDVLLWWFQIGCKCCL